MSGLGGLLDGLDAFRDDAASGAGKTGRLARSICDGYAGNPNLGKAVQIGFNGYDAPLEYGCGPYWNGPDGYAPPSGPREGPPFSGGQCEGVFYQVQANGTNSVGNAIVISVFGSALGPVGLGSISDVGEGPAGDPQRRYQVTITSGPTASESSTLVSSFSRPSLFVTRLDGNPDNCGDPPSAPVPRVPGSPPSGTGFGLPRDIGEPGDPFIVTPRPPDIGPNGPYFPVETPFGAIPFFPGNPDVELPTPPPSQGPPVDVAGGGELDAEDGGDEDAENSVLLGYRFAVRDDAPQFQSVIPGTSPRIYSRVVGSIQLKLRGGGETFYSDNLQITSQEGSIVKQHPTLQVVGCVYNVLPNLAGLTLYEIRGKDDDG